MSLSNHGHTHDRDDSRNELERADQMMTRLPSLARSARRIGVALLAGAVLAGGVKAADVPTMELEADMGFDVLRKGRPLGSHRIAFTRDGDKLIVDVDIALKAKFAFITVYRYRHHNREVWQDGRLVAIDTRTDDNGKSFTVSGRATPDGFAVTRTDQDGEETEVVEETIIPTSYWHPATTDQSRLLNTQTGRIAELTIEPTGADTVAFPNVDVPATGYATTGDIRLSLWYDAERCFLKLAFTAPGDGALIDYRVAEHLRGRHDPELVDDPLIGRCVGHRAAIAERQAGPATP